MDPDLHSPVDTTEAKATFHKPSHDSSNRKYRRRSPVSDSSSSDGEPTHSLEDTAKVNIDLQKKDDKRDYKRSRYSRDSGSNSNRHVDKRSYNDRRHDDYKRRDDDYRRHDKYADEDEKKSHKHSRDGSGHRSRDKRDDVRDEKRGHRSHHHKDNTSWRDSDDLKYGRFEKGKSYNQETRGFKDRHFKEPKEILDDDKSVVVARKSKFSNDKDTEYTKDADSGSKNVTVANEVQSSSSKQGQEQEFVKDSDIDAAKIAAMKAAELVNRNLIGTGIMSTDQKKKLLWGSKKTTTTEESAHRWDTSMFSDRERQEKFNKLMSLRWLYWYYIGCEGGPETGGTRRYTCGKAEGASDGFGETVHCWPSSQRWSYRRFRALNTFFLLYLYTCLLPFHYGSELSYAFENIFLIATSFVPHVVDLLMFCDGG